MLSNPQCLSLVATVLLASPALAAEPGHYQAHVAKNGEVKESVDTSRAIGRDRRAATPTRRDLAARDRFVDATQKRIDGVADRLSALKERRDRLNRTRGEYARLDLQANAMEGTLAEARANLKALKGADVRFAQYEHRLGDNLADLERTLEPRIAE